MILIKPVTSPVKAYPSKECLKLEWDYLVVGNVVIPSFEAAF